MEQTASPLDPQAGGGKAYKIQINPFFKDDKTTEKVDATAAKYVVADKEQAAQLLRRKDPLTLDELLHNQRGFPLSAAEFKAFLARRHCDENFDFLRDMRQLHVDFDEAPPTVDSHTALITRVEFLMDNYIKSGSAREINIDHTTRKKMVAAFQSCRDQVQDVGQTALSTSPLFALFDPAVSEVRRLIDTNKDVAVFYEENMRNITDVAVRYRYFTSGFFLASALGIFLALLILMDNTTGRWLRVLTIFPNVLGSWYMFSAYYGL